MKALSSRVALRLRVSSKTENVKLLFWKNGCFDFSATSVRFS